MPVCDGFEVTDRDVAVIGTGASAVQFVPPIAEQAGTLTVFQRTPIWCLPKPDASLPGVARAALRRIPGARRASRLVSQSFVELTFPEPGDYPFVSHLMIDAERGALLGKDILWETRARMPVPLAAYWFALWTAGNQWNKGAEMDVLVLMARTGGGKRGHVHREPAGVDHEVPRERREQVAGGGKGLEGSVQRPLITTEAIPLHGGDQLVIVDAAIVWAGDGAQFDAAVHRLQRLHLLGPMGGQPVL